MESDWQVVDNKTKDRAKQQDRAVRRKQAKAQVSQAEEERKAELDRLFKKHTTQTAIVTEKSIYSAFQPNDEIVIPRDPSKPKKQKKKQDTPAGDATAKLTARLADLAGAINVAQLTDALGALEAKYPGNHEVQLRGLAEILEEHLGPASPSSVVEGDYWEQSLDYPLQQLPSNLTDALTRWVMSKPKEALAPFLSFLIGSLISIYTGEEKHIQTSGIGLKYVSQIIARVRDTAVVQNLEQIKSKYMKSDGSFGKPEAAAFLSWLFGQTIRSHPAAALIVLNNIYLPTLLQAEELSKAKGVELVRSYGLVYTDAVANANLEGVQMRQLGEVVATSLLEKLLVAATNDAQLAGDSLRKILTAVINTFNASRTLSGPAFTLLLSHAAIDDVELRDSILQLLLQNIKTENLKHWRTVYTKHIAQTNNVLLSMVTLNDVRQLEKQFPKEELQNFLGYVSRKNSELLSSVATSATSNNSKPLPKKGKAISSDEQSDIEMCQLTCNSLEQQLRTSSGGMKTVCTVLFAVLATSAAGAAAYFYAQDPVTTTSVVNAYIGNAKVFVGDIIKTITSK